MGYARLIYLGSVNTEIPSVITEVLRTRSKEIEGEGAGGAPITSGYVHVAHREGNRLFDRDWGSREHVAMI